MSMAKRPQAPEPGLRFLRQAEVVRLLGVSRVTLWIRRRAGSSLAGCGWVRTQSPGARAKSNSGPVRGPSREVRMASDTARRLAAAYAKPEEEWQRVFAVE